MRFATARGTTSRRRQDQQTMRRAAPRRGGGRRALAEERHVASAEAREKRWEPLKLRQEGAFFRRRHVHKTEPCRERTSSRDGGAPRLVRRRRTGSTKGCSRICAGGCARTTRRRSWSRTPRRDEADQSQTPALTQRDAGLGAPRRAVALGTPRNGATPRNRACGAPTSRTRRAARASGRLRTGSCVCRGAAAGVFLESLAEIALGDVDVQKRQRARGLADAPRARSSAARRSSRRNSASSRAGGSCPLGFEGRDARGGHRTVTLTNRRFF